MVKIEYLTPASPEERKRYYREEWNIKQVPEYITHSIQEENLVLIMLEEALTIGIKFSELLIYSNVF